MKLKKYAAFQFLEYALAMVFAAPLYLMPRKMALRGGEYIGSLMYHILPRRREIGYNNLTLAFGDELSDEEKQHILKLNFKNLGKSIAEVLHFAKMSKEYVRGKVTIVGQEHYWKAKKRAGKVIYLTAHVGNWEMGPFALSTYDTPGTGVVRPLDNRYLDRHVTRLRTRYGNKLLARREGMRDILAALKRHEDIGILMDQNTKRSQGVFVDFFGKPASTIPVIAVLALRYNVPVIPIFIVRTGFDTHTIHVLPEVTLEKTGDPRKDIETNTAHFNKIIEDFIRQYPDQWFWVHNRWKTQPYQISQGKT